jgi:hypothetical protein
MSRKPTTVTSRFTKFVRGRGDGTRHVYTLGRRVLRLRSYLTRRRVAHRVRPTADVAVAPEDGFRVFPAGVFAEAEDGASAAAQLLATSEAALHKRRQQPGSKQFLVNLLPPDELAASHPLVRLALRTDLLESVIAYMGTVPILRSVQVFYSGSVDREPVSSQLYHCDADDVRQLKIFLLCSEVRHENGPLTILDATSSDRVRRATSYVYDGRLSDAEVAQVLGKPSPVELVGSQGTMCLVDTSRCFHYGSRVFPGAAPRLVAMIQYLSPFAFVVPGNARGNPLAHVAGSGHTPLQHAVLTGDDRHLWGWAWD